MPFSHKYLSSQQQQQHQHSASRVANSFQHQNTFDLNHVNTTNTNHSNNENYQIDQQQHQQQSQTHHHHHHLSHHKHSNVSLNEKDEQNIITSTPQHHNPVITTTCLTNFSQSQINTPAISTSALALVSSSDCNPNANKFDDYSSFRIRHNFIQQQQQRQCQQQQRQCQQQQQQQQYSHPLSHSLPTFMHPEHDSIQKTTLDIIEKILPFCSLPLVRDFLFSEQLPSSLSQATPIPSHHALSCRFQVNVMDAPPFLGPLHYNPSPTRQIDRSFTFVPSWVSDHFIIGFGNEQDLLHTPVTRRNVRFARNQKDAAFLLTRAGEIGPDHLVLHYSHHETSTAHVRSCVRFRRRALAQALKAPPESQLNQLICALLAVEHIREFRRCPICSTHGFQSNCTCPRPVSQSASDPNIAAGTTPRSGIFEGVSLSASFVNGRVLHSTCLATRMQLHVSNEPSLPSPPPPPPPPPPQAGTTLSTTNTEDGPENWTEAAEEIGGGQDGIIPELLQESGVTTTGVWNNNNGINTSNGIENNFMGIRNNGEMTTVTNEMNNVWNNNNNPNQLKRKIGDVERERIAHIRRMKAELRRERNRASAHRSNMKKKAINDALKAELQQAHERVEELRAREVNLRQENMRLRRMLTG